MPPTPRTHVTAPIPLFSCPPSSPVRPGRGGDPLVLLAQRLADLVPPLEGSLATSAAACQARDDFIGDIALGLANAAHWDLVRIDRAIGPDIEVGVDPMWRCLLASARELVGAADDVVLVAL